MTGFVVTLMVLVGVPLLLGARSRIARLEYRLRLVEEELPRRIAARKEVLQEEPWSAPEQAPAPEAEELAEPDEPYSEPIAEPVARPAATFAIPATRIIKDVEPETEEVADTEAEFEVEAEAEAEAEAGPDPDLAYQDEPVTGPTTEPEFADAEAVDESHAMSRASINFEELFGRKLPIWAGGITLAIAGVLIVKYAIDIGLFGRVFTPGVQAICGMLFGLGLIGGAEWAWRRQDRVDDPRVAQALSGAGISSLYAALLVAANVYHLITPLTAFFGLALVTGGALWLSLRHGIPSALLGLAGGLAAPALTVGLDANVPMLATYLAFTIAGLVGVSRFQRWPWLALMALAGGAGWSLWLIVAGQALTALGALSVGTFILLLGVALPLLAFTGAAANLLRAGSAIIGAVQLALLVAMGGYQPLHWGLFVLIAAAGQWLAWRNRDFAIVPTLSAALSVLLLMLWPEPTGLWLATIGLALTAIHALPLLAKLWREPVRLQWAVELSAIAAAIPLVMLRHFHAPWGAFDLIGSLGAAGGAMIVLAGAALGWKERDREEDIRFTLLLATGGGLLAVAAWLGFAHWQAPLWIGAFATALLLLSPIARDRLVEPLAAAFSGLGLLALAVTFMPDRGNEVAMLFGADSSIIDLPSLLRWSGLAVIFALFAWRAANTPIRLTAAFISTALAYGAAAQLVPGWTLPLIMAALASVLLLVLGRRESEASEAQILPFAAGSIMLLAITGPHPLGEWLRLADAGSAPADMLSALRWLAPFALGMLLAVRARLALLRGLGQLAALAFAYGALAQLVPGWSLPIAMALVAAIGLLVHQRAAASASTEIQLLLFGGFGVILLVVTGQPAADQWQRMWGLGLPGPDGFALARWAALAALFALFSVRGRSQPLRMAGQGMAALLAYGAAAQVIPLVALPLLPATGVLVLAAAGHRLPWPAPRITVVVLASLSAAWAVAPLGQWLTEATWSMAGQPMLMSSPDLSAAAILRRLLGPALLMGGALWLLRKSMSQREQIVVGGVVGGMAVIALHCLYRAGFAATFGADFIAVGLGQRLLWDALLLGAAACLWKRGTGALATRAAPVLIGIVAWHAAWYSLLLHNPLWTAQNVGGWPLGNLILPLFAMLPASLTLLGRVRREYAGVVDRVQQPVLMLMIAMFTWASLRQAFHGTLLVDPGVTQPEDILRSILGIGLAVGYLLWGIAKGRRDWRIASLVLMLAAVAKVFLFDASGLEGLLRIASFVALGFSLIGIGWLYSRQLRKEGSLPEEPTQTSSTTTHA